MKDFETEIFIKDLRKYWIRKPTHVIHCGAHHGEEANSYYSNQMSPVIWIEAVPSLIPKLREQVKKFPRDVVLQAALWSSSGISKTIFIANNSFSTSMLCLGTHKKSYPEIDYVGTIEVMTSTLDSLSLVDGKSGDRYLLVLDLQGVEFEVLKGGIDLLKHCDFIYTEVSKEELYANQAVWSEIDLFLKESGFKLADWQYSRVKGWGNALYVRSDTRFLGPRRLFRKISHRKRYNLELISG
jgi:FkbM family methyltransferase